MKFSEVVNYSVSNSEYFWNVRGWKFLSIFMYSILLCGDAGLFSLFGMRHSWQHWHPKLQLQKVEVFFIFTEFWAFQDHFYFENVLRCRRKKTISVVYFFNAFFHECEIRIFFFLYGVNFIWKRQQNYIFLDRFKRIT